MQQLTQEELDSIRSNPNQQDWTTLSHNYVLPEEFIREFQGKVDWHRISRNQTLSEAFMREFQYKVYWNWVSRNQTLSEAFIREFRDKVVWVTVSRNQTLSEAFIREFRYKVSWRGVFCYQVLSEEFIREFQDRFGTSDVSTLRRPVTYSEIMSYDPCSDGVERYLKHTKEKETVTWNTLLERHSYKADISWLYDERNPFLG